MSIMGTSADVQIAQRVSALRRGVGISALVAVAEQVAAVSGVNRRIHAMTRYRDAQSMGLISTLLQGSVVTMRLWVSTPHITKRKWNGLESNLL